jgi:hypothetical protein
MAWPQLIDRRSRTYWWRGGSSPVTLVETDEPPATSRPSRLRDLVAGRQRGGTGDGRPPGDPAFSEALFVELVRTGQYQRAFSLLAPPCQRSWGSPERFAEAHQGGALSHLDGVSVVAVRHLDEWVDPHRGDRHRGVAELDVEYGFAAGERTAVLRRTVHLVAVDGRWRSLSYPATQAGTPAASSAA